MATSSVSSNTGTSEPPRLRILLETDAPYMTPANLPTQSFGIRPGARLPFSHSGMIPWTAEFVADVATRATEGEITWTTADILRISAENARCMYGV